MAVKISGKTLKELQEERANIYTNAQSYLQENEDNWTDDHQATYEEQIADVSTLKQAIENRVKAQSLESSASLNIPADDPRPDVRGAGRDEPETIRVRDYGFDASGRGSYDTQPVGRRGSSDYQTAWTRYLAHGAAGLQPEQRAALQSDNASQAGYLTASEQFAAGLLADVDDLLFIRRYGRVHTVREAQSLGIRKRTARMNTWGWSQELQVSTADSTLAFGKKVLTPHHLTGMIKVSRDLLRRGVLSVDEIVREEMAYNAATVMEDAFLTGTGAEQPLGVFTASSDGISTDRDVQTGSSTSITADGLHNAKYSLKSQYRDMGPRWLFHRDAVKIISKLKDGEGQYLWRPGITMGTPDTLFGFPVDESERAPNTFTTGLYVGLLAVWRFYEIADALDVEVQVLNELYSESNQVGYIGRAKCDAMPTLEEGFARLITN